MASFQAKIGWERPRKRKKKFSFRSLPTGRVIENSKKREENSKKIEKYNCGFISSKNRLEKAQR